MSIPKILTARSYSSPKLDLGVPGHLQPKMPNESKNLWHQAWLLSNDYSVSLT